MNDLNVSDVLDRYWAVKSSADRKPPVSILSLVWAVRARITLPFKLIVMSV